MRHVHRHRNSSAPPTRCNSHPKQQARPPQQKHLCSRNSRPLTTGGGGRRPLGLGHHPPPPTHCRPEVPFGPDHSPGASIPAFSGFGSTLLFVFATAVLHGWEG